MSMAVDGFASDLEGSNKWKFGSPGRARGRAAVFL